MRLLQLWWARKRLRDCDEELLTFQASFEVGPTYLVNVMQHRTELEWRIAALSN